MSVRRSLVFKSPRRSCSMHQRYVSVQWELFSDSFLELTTSAKVLFCNANSLLYLGIFRTR